VSTGISARDRATTIRAAIADDAGPHKIVSPGHVFPLRARKGGVLVRTGQTEGSVDLARLAGLKPAGVICEIMREDGEMARRPELEEFAKKHGLLLLSVADMIAYRLQRERIVRCQATGVLRPGTLGPGEPFAAHYYDTEVEETEYLALVRGDVAGVSAAGGTVLVRVAAMDPLADPFCLRPDLVSALKAIDDAGVGVFLYVVHRGRMKLKGSFDRLVMRPKVTDLASAGAWQDRESTKPGMQSTAGSSEALRDFGLGAQVLADLGCHKIRLMMWSDRKIPGLEGFGIDVVERVPIPPPPATKSAATRQS
jgi:3,4-dihydroxy 2-butanone 4-phosphate synthase/GTP cyclohydrolase II